MESKTEWVFAFFSEYDFERKFEDQYYSKQPSLPPPPQPPPNNNTSMLPPPPVQLIDPIIPSSSFQPEQQQQSSSFTQTFLRGILTLLDSRDPVVANAWLETLLDAIDLLPI